MKNLDLTPGGSGDKKQGLSSLINLKRKLSSEKAEKQTKKQPKEFYYSLKR